MASPIEASITCIVNGQTITIGDITVEAFSTGTGAQSKAIALNLSRPIKVDRNTVIGLALAGVAGTSTNATACVHIVEQRA